MIELNDLLAYDWEWFSSPFMGTFFQLLQNIRYYRD